MNNFLIDPDPNRISALLFKKIKSYSFQSNEKPKSSNEFQASTLNHFMVFIFMVLISMVVIFMVLSHTIKTNQAYSFPRD